tara:strand:- start:17655 stop:18095 length:441 start_codon:yes stop_codon:yes gene_type:complete
MGKAKKKDPPIGYELLNPETNRGIGVAVIKGEACVLASKTGISQAVMLLSRLRLVGCEGKLYVPYDEVVGWFYNEIEDEERDPSPNADYVHDLRQNLKAHKGGRDFVERYRQRRADLEMMIVAHERPSLPEDEKPTIYVTEGLENE